MKKTYRNSVLPRVPASMQDFLVEVKCIQSHVLPQSTRTYAVLCSTTKFITRQRTTDLLGLERRLVCLQNDVVQGVHVVYPEVVVV